MPMRQRGGVNVVIKICREVKYNNFVLFAKYFRKTIKFKEQKNEKQLYLTR